MSRRSKLFAAILLVCCSSTVQLSYAEEIPSSEYAAQNTPATDVVNQVDITRGLAEQSAMHASRFSPSGYATAEMQNYGSPGMQYAAAPIQQSGQTQLQSYANQNAYSQQYQQNCSQNFTVPAQQYKQQVSAPQAASAPQQGGSFNGINQQMVGVLGAAVLFNYMTNGGVQNIVGEMGSRGWGGRFRTMGPGGVVYH